MGKIRAKTVGIFYNGTMYNMTRNSPDVLRDAVLNCCKNAANRDNQTDCSDFSYLYSLDGTYKELAPYKNIQQNAIDSANWFNIFQYDFQIYYVILAR